MSPGPAVSGILTITGDGQVLDVACTLGGLLTCDVAAMYAHGTGAPLPSATARRVPAAVALTSAV